MDPQPQGEPEATSKSPEVSCNASKQQGDEPTDFSHVLKDIESKSYAELEGTRKTRSFKFTEREHKRAVKYKMECLDFIAKLDEEELWRVHKELKRFQKMKTRSKDSAQDCSPIALNTMVDAFCTSLQK